VIILSVLSVLCGSSWKAVEPWKLNFSAMAPHHYSANAVQQLATNVGRIITTGSWVSVGGSIES